MSKPTSAFRGFGYQPIGKVINHPMKKPSVLFFSLEILLYFYILIKTKDMESLILLPIVAFVFYHLGKYKERVDWNQLIKDGVLPKPFKK